MDTNWKPKHRDLAQHLKRHVPSLGIRESQPLNPALGEQALKHTPKVVQHPGQRRMLREGSEQHRPGQAARFLVPLGELPRRGGLAAARIGVQEHDTLLVERTV